MEKHYCIIVNRYTKKEIRDMGIIEAEDWYYARHIAASRYKQENPNDQSDWCVDSCKVE